MLKQSKASPSLTEAKDPNKAGKVTNGGQIETSKQVKDQGILVKPIQSKATTTDQLLVSKQVDSPKKRQVVQTVHQLTQVQPDQASNASFNVSYVYEEPVKHTRKDVPVDYGALNAGTRHRVEQRKNAKLAVRDRFANATVIHKSSKDSKERNQATQVEIRSKENNSMTPSVSGMSNVYEGRRVKPMAVIKKFRIYDADDTVPNNNEYLELPLSS